jgi:hypothetical protein
MSRADDAASGPRARKAAADRPDRPGSAATR